MKDLSKLKVAIVHDWLVGGGAELVVEQLHKMFPEAPIYTSYCTKEWRKRLNGKVRTGVLQHWPFSRLRKFLPVLRIWWFTHLDFSGYDLVISSSGNGEAKGIKTPKDTLHICYCHTPIHFLWRHHQQYLRYPGFGPLASVGLKLLTGPLRSWDKKAARRPDYFIANSTHIQSDIKKYYGRDSVVIHPPVDTERFGSAVSNQRKGFITVGRQVPYKRVDIIVDACTKLNLPLTVIGAGPEHQKLKRRAGPTVTFPGYLASEEIPAQIASSKGFILAAFEDFGITPVEALAAGTPVIAYKAGGALDYIQDDVNGLFFEEQTSQSLLSALEKFQKRPNFDPKVVSRSAQPFSPNHFRQQLEQFIKKVLA